MIQLNLEAGSLRQHGSDMYFILHRIDNLCFRVPKKELESKVWMKEGRALFFDWLFLLT